MMLSKLILDLCNKLATVFCRVHPQAPKREGGKITLNQTSDTGWLDRRTGDQTDLTETLAQQITATWNLLNLPKSGEPILATYLIQLVS